MPGHSAGQPPDNGGAMEGMKGIERTFREDEKVNENNVGDSSAGRGRRATGERSPGRPPFRRRRRFAGVVLVAGAALLVLLAAGFASAENGIRRGVEIGGVEAGGMSRAEAREILERQVDSDLEQISFGEARVPRQELGVRLDAGETVGQAYAVGREGWIGARLTETLQSYVTGVEVPAAVEYDERAARQAVSEVAEEVERGPREASYRVAGGEVEVVGGEPGRELNEKETLKNLNAALDGMESEVELAMEEDEEPEVSAGELDAMKPTEKIGEYETDGYYSDSQTRRQNLRTVSKAINGTVLEPGEVFSFNDLAASQDYKAAKVFSEGGEATALGGGLCQVSSTLYMAAQYAGLEIVERNAHYAVLPYIRPGFDATVWFGYNGTEELDMRFKNTTDGNIYIREYMDEDGFLKAEIYGRPTGKEVEMRSEQVYRDLDRGLKWRTYKTVEEDGETVRDGLLYEDVYSFPPASEVESNAPRVGGWD